MQHKWLDDSSLDAAKSDGTPGWQPSASSYESLGGPAGLGDRFTLGGGVKAVSRGVGTIDLFAVTSAGSLLHKSFDAGAWSPDWETVGTGIAGTPAVESVETSRLDVFVASSGSPATLRHKAWSGTTWPASWDEIGGPISGSPVTAITSPGNIDVFVTGADGALNFKSLSGNTWTPSMTGFISPDGVAPNLGGALLGSPSVASWGANRIDLFVAGPIHELYHRSYDPTPPNLGWMPNWEDLGGIVGW
jgi:hypothetical protein